MIRPIHCRLARLAAALALAVLVFHTHDSSARSGRHRGVYYEAAGHGGTVVFLHGGQMDRRMWDEQFELFAKTHRVVRYDLRGFGKSPAPLEPYSHVEDLRALLDHLKIRRATLVGLSLGAAIAVDFAL